MLLLIFLLPVITSIILLCFFRKKVDFWEYAVLFGSTWLIIGFMYGIMKSVNSSDIKYTDYYVIKTSYYESWNERQRRTRTVTTGSGKNKVTHTQVYYVTVNHPEHWEITLNNNDTHIISKSKYNKLKTQFGTEPKFRDMHRSYYTKDGDAYDVYFDIKKRNTLEVYSDYHYYTNKVKASKSVFKFIEISDEDRVSYKLFDYPESKNSYRPCILGYNKFSKSDIHYIDVINSLYGKNKDFHLYMLFFKDMPVSVVEYQKSYWEGGNQNELVLCFGYSENTINWCEGFSWCDDPIVEANCKMYFIEHPELNEVCLKNFSEFLENQIKTNWHAKNFEDFDYLTIELSTCQLWIVFIVSLLINIGVGIYVVMNGINLCVNEK